MLVVQWVQTHLMHLQQPQQVQARRRCLQGQVLHKVLRQATGSKRHFLSAPQQPTLQHPAGAAPAAACKQMPFSSLTAQAQYLLRLLQAVLPIHPAQQQLARTPLGLTCAGRAVGCVSDHQQRVLPQQPPAAAARALLAVAHSTSSGSISRCACARGNYQRL